VPLAVATIALAVASVPDSQRADAPQTLDWPGALCVAAGLGALTYGLTEASSRGFGDSRVFGMLIAGAVLLAVFVRIEWTSRDPMMPLDVFHSRDFNGANLVTLLLYFALFGVLFFLPFTLIRAYDYSATQAGAAVLPMPLVIGVLSRLTGGMTSRFGSRALLTIGPCVAAIGFAMLGFPFVAGSYWAGFLPALLVLGLGMTITVAPLTTTVMASVSGERTGVASGINNAVARVAGLLAVAVLGIAFVRSYDASLMHRLDALNVPQAMRSLSLEGSGSNDANIRQAEAQAIADALRAVALASAGCALGAAVLALLMISKKR
jgi:hypothetical protein